MILYVIIGTFGAFGLLCAAWILLGCRLAHTCTGMLVLHTTAERAEFSARRFVWLRNMALVPPRLILVGPFLPQYQQKLSRQYPQIEFLTPEQYLLRLEQERKNVDGS